MRLPLDCRVLMTTLLLACGTPESARPDLTELDAGGDDAASADAAPAVVVPVIEQTGCWTIETLTGSPYTTSFDAVAFVLDAADQPHLAYREANKAIYARAVAGGYARTA